MLSAIETVLLTSLLAPLFQRDIGGIVAMLAFNCLSRYD